MRFLYYCLMTGLCILFSQIIVVNNAHSDATERDFETIAKGEMQTFQEVEKKLKILIDSAIKTLLPFVIRASANTKLSGRCMANILKVVQGTQKLQEWAIRMMDATGKLPSGFFQGTIMSMGDYDECVNIRVGKGGLPPALGDREYFHGKYCTVKCGLPKGILDAIFEVESAPLADKHNTSIGHSKTFLNLLLKYGHYAKVAYFRIGVCVPSMCGEEDLEGIATTISEQLGFPLTVLHCQEKENVVIKKEQIVIFVILSIIVSIVLLCTVIDVYLSKQSPDSFSILKRCVQKTCNKLSAISSTKRLIDVTDDNHPIPVIRGFFLVTIAITMLAHTYVMYNHLMFFKSSGLMNYYDYMQQFTFSLIANGSNFLENYFFIAGFFVTFINLKKSVEIPKKDIFSMVVKPYIRMSLMQLLAIALFLLLPLFGYGPFWNDFVGPYLQNCREKWWLNLFYIQNYWESHDTCLYHTWILAVVMQLYVISLFIIWILRKKPNLGVFFIMIMVVVSMAIVGTIVFVNKFPGAISLYLLDPASVVKMWNTLYIKTYDHVGSFAIGMLTGYIVVKYKHKLDFGKKLTAILWFVSLASVTAVIFGLFEYRSGSVPMVTSLSIFYAMVNRNVYTLFIAWFVIACETGKAGFVPDILSWKALIPVYRLSYLAYMLHLLVIYYYIGIMRENVYFSHEGNVLTFFGYLGITFVLSYICYIFFQAPYMCLESFLVSKDTTEKVLKKEATSAKVDFKCADVHKHFMSHIPTIAINSVKDNHNAVMIEN